MERAVKMWETSKYWTMRAKGAIHAAKYKELPRVRVNRIKGLEADKRKQERNKANAEKFLSLWGNPDKALTLERAKAIANHDWISRCFTLDKYPRKEPISQYEGMKSLWSALDDGIINERQAAEIAIPSHIKSIAYADRWIRHLDNRLLYETAMLDEQGASDLLKPAPRAEQLPLYNYRAPEGFVMIENRYTRGEMIKYPQVDMTKAEYAKIYTDYKGTRTVENTHRVRIAIKAHEWFTVFITDSKIHVKPEPAEDKARVVTQEPANPEADLREMWTSQGISEERQNKIIADTTAKAQPGAQVGPWTIPAEDKDAQFRAMKDTLKEGIKTVVAPQLFPTPPEIAERMVELAQIEPEKHWVLEPSAGTGNLLSALPENTSVLAIERNNYLAGELQRRFFHHDEGGLRITVRNQDFLQFIAHEPDDIIPDAGFDRIIMNPPFENGVDIKHIRHALKKLNSGGRLVALCANGPRQREAFMDIAEYWENLPAGSFKEQGTGVNVALMVIIKED